MLQSSTTKAADRCRSTPYRLIMKTRLKVMPSISVLLLLLASVASCAWAGTTFKQHLVATVFIGRGTACGVVAAIEQLRLSSKCTLLNTVYGTRIDTMSTTDGQTRATRGVRAQCSSAQPQLLLLVVLGTGLTEDRVAAAKTFDPHAAPFVVGMAARVMLNISKHNVVRREAPPVRFDRAPSLFSSFSYGRLLARLGLAGPQGPCSAVFRVSRRLRSHFLS